MRLQKGYIRAKGENRGFMRLCKGYVRVIIGY